MDYELSEDQAAFRDVARQFSDRQLAPNAADWDANKTFPKDVIKAAGDLGFCGLYCPESAGGLGLSRLDSSIILNSFRWAVPLPLRLSLSTIWPPGW